MALRRSDQFILDKFFEAVLQHRAPIGNPNSLLPEERKKFDKLQAELRAEIEELNKQVDRLMPPPK